MSLSSLGYVSILLKAARQNGGDAQQRRSRLGSYRAISQASRRAKTTSNCCGEELDDASPAVAYQQAWLRCRALPLRLLASVANPLIQRAGVYGNGRWRKSAAMWRMYSAWRWLATTNNGGRRGGITRVALHYGKRGCAGGVVGVARNAFICAARTFFAPAGCVYPASVRLTRRQRSSNMLRVFVRRTARRTPRPTCTRRGVQAGASPDAYNSDEQRVRLVWLPPYYRICYRAWHSGYAAGRV